MNYKIIAIILSLVLTFVLSKSVLEYRISNIPMANLPAQ